MGLIRNYCIIRNEVAANLGLPEIVTFSVNKGDHWLLRHSKIVQFSDYVIQCNSDGYSYYIKNRREPHRTAMVDPEYLIWVKLSSVELE